MTTRELLLDAAEDSNLNGESLHPKTKSRLLRYLNEGMRRVLSTPGLGTRLTNSDPPFTFATVASTARYVLPESIAAPWFFTERTNQRRLMPMSLDQYRSWAPDPTIVTGTPTHYVPIGRVLLATLPSAAAELFIKSTSANDIYEAYLEAVITAGYTQTAAVLMTGTTAVSFDATLTSVIDVSDVYLATPAVGTVTIHQTSGAGTELARISKGNLKPRYQGFYLYPTPSAAVTYYVDSQRRTTALLNDDDEPPWDEDFHFILSAYARMRQYEKTNDVRYQLAKEAWDTGREALTYRVNNPADLITVPGGRDDRGSNLGPWFPPGRW